MCDLRNEKRKRNSVLCSLADNRSATYQSDNLPVHCVYDEVHKASGVAIISPKIERPLEATLWRSVYSLALRHITLRPHHVSTDKSVLGLGSMSSPFRLKNWDGSGVKG